MKEVEEKTIILLKDIDNIYLQSSRVKTVDSLIVKVINRRYKYINSKKSRYNQIDDDNYVDIITDLVGIRLIIAHMGDWKDIHEQLMIIFPMNKDYQYNDDDLIERNEAAMQALLPHAYYLDGEKEIEDMYVENGITAKLSNEGYRSIHYTVTFQNYYIEIQLRPLFMEQWCMCSHNYVYKKEANSNHVFLENMSRTLENMTDMSGEIGDLMKAVYEGEYYVKANGNAFLMNENGIKCVDKLIEMCNNSMKELQTLKNRIELEEK